MAAQLLTHTFDPVFDSHSRILVLGTFPSVKSRENHFYYGHPQNRFWRLMSELTAEPLPADISAKKELLLKHGIALWDVLASCEITGSSDSSIRRPVANNINLILQQAPIELICANGGKAFELYEKHCQPQTKRKAVKLPSTSPANASWSLEKLLTVWGEAFREVFSGQTAD